MSAKWTLTDYGGEPSLYTDGWRDVIDIDPDGDLRIESKVDGDACDTRLYVPMPLFCEFLRACGYEVTPPPRSSGTPTDPRGEQ